LGVLQERDVNPLLGSFEDLLSSCPFSFSVLFISEDGLTEKTLKFSFPRFHGSSVHRSLSMNSLRSTSNGLPQKSLLNLNSNVTTGINADAPVSVNLVSGLFNRGANIMDRIGEPDHTGWMRKRGERFNSWKNRYFILKGPHLYFLRSNNKSVSCAPLIF
jgi:hypothetical protein